MYHGNGPFVEGREALDILGKPMDREQSSTQGNRQNIQAERKLLDQKPRDARLQSRKGSPLGLTLEELDDRGLLDGGGVVPSYYTSLRQRNRRHLEMQNRSSRLQHRGHEEGAKFKSMMKMIRVLVRKGLNLDECFRHLDFEGRGVVEREQFVAVVRGLGLPFQVKHILALADRYSMSAVSTLSLQVDYETFINDTVSGLASIDGDDSLGSGAGGRTECDKPYAEVIVELRRMLVDSKLRLNKSDDDVYRMFSKWDSSGKGLVTITQFFRVLEQLHVVLSDSGQDAVVEILDVDGKGKVDFDSFLGYCTSDDDAHDYSALGAGGATDRTDESMLSGGGSTAGGTATSELRSATGRVRPHTAAAFRGASTNGADRGGYTGCGDEGDSYTSHHDHVFDPTEGSPAKSVQQRRPLTASGRVLNGEYRARERDRSNGTPGKPVSSDDGNFFILDIASDEERDDLPLADDGASYTHTLELVSPESGSCERYSGNVFEREPRQPPTYHTTSTPVRDGNMPVPAEEEDLYRPDRGHRTRPIQRAHSGPLQQQTQHRSSGTQSADRANVRVVQDRERERELIRIGSRDTRVYGNESGEISRRQHGTNQSAPAIQRSPPQQLPHNVHQQVYSNGTIPLGNLAIPTVTPQAVENARASLRQAIIAHYNQYGSTLRDLFSLIDRNGVRYFNARDLMVAAKSHFHLPFGPQTATALVNIMALDGHDRISFSEFVVFVNDPQFGELEEKLQMQVCAQLEQQGREYQYLLFSVLSHESSGGGHEDDGSAAPASGMVSCASFGQSLLKLGLMLDAGEVDRIVTRFDTHGSGQCSVSRFMSMIQGCEKWKFTLDTLAYHEEAIEECQVVRQRMMSNSRHAIKNTFDEETLEMAEYLGIRILSEPHLLWIVEKAVSAPLPDGWSVHNDRDGRTFFFNADAGITRWDHPLDPYFRQLRDDHRKKQQILDAQQDSAVMAHAPSIAAPYASRNIMQTSNYHHSATTHRNDSEPQLQQAPLPSAAATLAAILPPKPAEATTEESPSVSYESPSVEDDELSDYYKLRRKPIPQKSKGRATRPASANESQQQTTTNKDQGGSGQKHPDFRSSRPTSAPFDRMEAEHTYRTKRDPSWHGGNSGRGPKRVGPSRGSTSARQKPVSNSKPPLKNILLPGGIYTTGLSSTPKAQSDKRAQQSGGTTGRVSRTLNRAESPQSQRLASRTGGSSGEYVYNAHGHREKKRPSSSGATRPLTSGGRPLSMQERNKLNQMFDAGVLDQLDDALGGNSGKPFGGLETRDGHFSPVIRGGGHVPMGEYERNYDRDRMSSSQPYYYNHRGDQTKGSDDLWL